MVVGDLMSQEIEYRQGHLLQRYDWWRVGRMFIVGAIQGPMHHYFYGWLDRVYRIANGQNVTKKILYDQIVMSPACIAAFFYSAGWLEGRTTADCTDELKQKAVRVYVVRICDASTGCNAIVTNLVFFYSSTDGLDSLASGTIC